MKIYFTQGFLLLMVLVCFYVGTEADGNLEENTKEDSKKKDALPPCQACKMLANSFKKVNNYFFFLHFGTL